MHLEEERSANCNDGRVNCGTTQVGDGCSKSISNDHHSNANNYVTTQIIVATQPATVAVESAVEEGSAQNHTSVQSKMQSELDSGVQMTAPKVQSTIDTTTEARQ